MVSPMKFDLLCGVINLWRWLFAAHARPRKNQEEHDGCYEDRCADRSVEESLRCKIFAFVFDRRHHTFERSGNSRIVHCRTVVKIGIGSYFTGWSFGRRLGGFRRGLGRHQVRHREA